MRLASIKLISGEEILAEVLDYILTDSFSSIIIKNPVKLEFTSLTRRSKKEYKLIPWILFTNTDEHEINMKNIIGLSSIEDETVYEEYKKFFNKLLKPGPRIKRFTQRSDKFNPEYGYLGSVNEFRSQLERLYRMDSGEEKPKDL